MASLAKNTQVIERKLGREIRGRARDEVYEAMLQGGELVRKYAQQSIASGSKSGRAHIPSAPGQPPNRDTGELDRNIVVVGDRRNMRVRVVSRSRKSDWLEFGTRKMLPRPFMRPALRANRAEVTRLITNAVRRAIRMSKKR